MVLMVLWDCVWPMTGKYTIDYFQYQGDVGCVCMLNDWISSNHEICAVNYIYSRFKLKGKCRSEKWEVYLYGDMTIKVELAQVQFLDSGDMPIVVTTGLGVQSCRKMLFSTVAVFGKVADVPARAVHRHGVDVPVSMQRRRLALGGATDSVHRLMVDIPVAPRVHAMKGGRSSSNR